MELSCHSARGFVPKELPKDVTLALGPAQLTEKFTTEKDGVVLAHLVFDSVKRRYTVAEATALRNQVADLISGPAILIDFEPQAEALLRDGKVKEALASYRALVAPIPMRPCTICRWPMCCCRPAWEKLRARKRGWP